MSPALGAQDPSMSGQPMTDERREAELREESMAVVPVNPPKGKPDPDEPRDLTLARKLARNLYRLGLLLIVGFVLFLFRGVLLPFAIAVLLAYLLFPIIHLMERLG